MVSVFSYPASEERCPQWFFVLKSCGCEERYLAAEDTPVTARRFLASTLSLNRHFQGALPNGFRSTGLQTEAWVYGSAQR